MPLLNIQSLAPTEPAAIARMIQEVRDAGARALRCSADNIWVVFQAIETGQYSHGHEKSHPAIVVIRAQSGRPAGLRESFVKAVAEAIGRGLSIPSENVWIHYQEMRPEDVWFEGRWAGSGQRTDCD
jgi:phenylpyruvate tautomerase PptA (4-oxalocrotonate tautomerase family)